MTTVMNIIDKQKGTIIMCDSNGDTCLCFIALSNTQREHFQELVRPEWFLGVKADQCFLFLLPNTSTTQLFSISNKGYCMKKSIY